MCQSARENLLAHYHITRTASHLPDYLVQAGLAIAASVVIAVAFAAADRRQAAVQKQQLPD